MPESDTHIAQNFMKVSHLEINNIRIQGIQYDWYSWS